MTVAHILQLVLRAFSGIDVPDTTAQASNLHRSMPCNCLALIMRSCSS